MRLFSGVYFVHQTLAVREGYSWEAGRWIPNSNFEMAGNNRNQGGFESFDQNQEGTPSRCFAEHVDIDEPYEECIMTVHHGVYGTAHMVWPYNENFLQAKKCQQECQQFPQCEYFVWEAATKNCDLYHDFKNIEYDEDDSELKVMGPKEGCLPCHREHWDYVKTGSGHNLIGKRAIYGVISSSKCGLICSRVPGCSFWSHDVNELKCFLKNANAEQSNEMDDDFNSGPKSCITEDCIMRGQNFRDPYFSSYNIIGKRITELIPGITDPGACESLCQLVDSCTHWTLDQDDEGCYLVDSPEALEYSDDKTSGPKSCDIKVSVETCNKDGFRPREYQCSDNNQCGANAKCILDSNLVESCLCTTGFKYIDNNCVDIDECTLGTHECGTSKCFNLPGSYRCTTTVDVVWAIDATGSYKGNVATAKKIRYGPKKIIYLVNGPLIPGEGLEFRMGLTFWSDRLFQSNEMNAGQYHCALPLTSISKITSSMISKAFTSISRMHGGGDAEEDVLLGIVFSRTDPRVGWLPDSVKQMHFFTDNPFHYYNDGTASGRKGSSTPPMNMWTSQPSGLYRYYDKTAVSAFTRGCEWNGQCGGDFKREWALDQIFFNLVNCDAARKQLYIDTFDVVPTALADWTPETGLIDTESFVKLTAELDTVMKDTVKIVEFSKCQISENDCKIPAECVESINGRDCKCDDLKSAVGLNCTCT